jgi:hypothetical protein
MSTDANEKLILEVGRIAPATSVSSWAVTRHMSCQNSKPQRRCIACNAGRLPTAFLQNCRAEGYQSLDRTLKVFTGTS